MRFFFCFFFVLFTCIARLRDDNELVFELLKKERSTEHSLRDLISELQKRLMKAESDLFLLGVKKKDIDFFPFLFFHKVFILLMLHLLFVQSCRQNGVRAEKVELT